MLMKAMAFSTAIGILLLGGVAAAAAADPVALALHLTGDASRTMLSIEMNGPVSYKAFALEKPYRIVVDLPAVEFRFGKLAEPSVVGLVAGFRYGLVGPGHSRIVIDTTGPVKVESTGFLSKEAQGLAQFKLVLAKTDPATFARQVPRKPTPKPPSDPVAEALVPKPRDANPRLAAPLVVLDPGHGGPDSGAVGPEGTEEKNIVLAIGKQVRDLLQAKGKFKVVMTRDTDVFVTLTGRVDYAEKRDADLLVSIHADSTSNSRHWQPVGGATIYTRSETASDEDARLVAMKENMSDQLAGEALPAEEGNAVSNIGMDLARTETKALDQILAQQAVSRLRSVVPMTLEPNRSARFYVLKSPKVPAMLVETGYVNNRRDSQLLQSPSGQAKIASAVAAAIEAYFKEREKGLPTLLGLSIPEAMP